jgi:tripartite-type tricarboxylate transporter receptor subunit TctC
MNWYGRKFISLVLAFAFLVSLSIPAFGAEYPVKPITLIIPFPAGGSTDLTSRALGKGAGKYLGQPIICDNKPGGAGGIGPSLVLTKPPDGYTIGMISTTPLINSARGTLNFNPVEDVTHIMRWGGYQVGLMVRSDAPWKNIGDFVEHAKKNPGKISYGTPGIGTPNHLTMEELGARAGINYVHVPYKGDSEMAMALLGGHLEAISGPIQTPLIEAGKIIVLATYGSRRSVQTPKAPTLQEAGFDIVCPVYVGIMGPKGMAKNILTKLHDAFKQAMDDSDFKAIMEKFDMPMLYLNSNDYEQHIRQDSQRIKELVRRLGLHAKP